MAKMLHLLLDWEYPHWMMLAGAILAGERHLRHVLLSHMNYYNETRTHLSLDKDAPVTRAVAKAGRIIARPILGGLHHQYARI
jgi:hypothetical protein